MKTLTTFFASLFVALALTNCSSDNESFQPVTDNTKPQEDVQIPVETLSDFGAVAIDGYPKSIKKFENGILSFWAQYYFRPDGNLLKVNYGHSSTTSEVFSNNYLYDAKGKIVKIIGWDDFQFYWENDRIIKVEGYNAAWNGRYHMFYEYNDQGRIIQKSTKWLDFTPVGYDITNYIYFPDGNLKSIEYYGDYNESGTFVLYSKTNFSNYIESNNLFLELEIIPGQRELFQFPGAKDYKNLTESGYDFNETYSYKYDTNGRVIEKLYGNNKIVYEYY